MQRQMLFVEMGIYIKGQPEIAVPEQLLGLFGIDPGIKKHKASHGADG